MTTKKSVFYAGFRALVKSSAIIFAMFLVGACATSDRRPDREKSTEISQFLKSQQLAVICTRGDEDTKRRAESEIVAKLREKGIPSIGGTTLIVTSPAPAWNELLAKLKKSGITFVMELDTCDEISRQGISPKTRMELLRISQPQAAGRSSNVDLASSLTLFLVHLISK